MIYNVFVKLNINSVTTYVFGIHHGGRREKRSFLNRTILSYAESIDFIKRVETRRREEPRSSVGGNMGSDL
jgi:hypothetical protein